MLRPARRHYQHSDGWRSWRRSFLSGIDDKPNTAILLGARSRIAQTGDLGHSHPPASSTWSSGMQILAALRNA
jgi:hypothetical protein